MRRSQIPYSCFLITLLSICSTNALQSSGESGNPFNQLMSSSGSVNLFSGDVAHTQPLVTLPGRNGMDVVIALNYSSNVNLNARSRNDKAPTGWCGLGWQLGFGSIFADHNGTRTYTDDKFYWISPVGYSSPILKKNGIYYIKDEPFSKVIPQLNASNDITGWIVTGIDGKKYKYGNLSFNDDRKADWHLFRWGDYIGSGFSGTPALHVYRWDVSEVEDVAGNKISYYYHQYTEQLRKADWYSVVQYTKESYLSKIINPEGKRIEFTIESKGSEGYDPYTFASEPDGFIEIYNKYRLSAIKVYSDAVSTSALHIFKLRYKSINEAALGTAFLKSLLTSIDEYRGGETNLSNKAIFTYYDDAGNTTENYNFGALHGITTLAGGSVEFSYKKQDVEQNLQKIRMAGQANIDQIRQMASGTVEGGNEYFVVVGGAGCPQKPYGDRVWVYNWDGSKWVNKIDFESWGDCGVKTIYAGHDYFVVRRVVGCQDGEPGDRISVWNWDGEEWVISNVDWENFGDCATKEIYAGDDFFVVRGGVGCPGKDPGDRITVLNKIGDQWQVSNINWESWGDCAVKRIYIGNNYFVVRGGLGCPGEDPGDRVSVYRWDGSLWTSDNISWESWSDCTPKNIYPGFNYFVVTMGAGCAGVDAVRDRVKVINWNGTQWQTSNISWENWGDCASKEIYIGKDYFIATGGTGCAGPGHSPKDQLSVINWTGEIWQMSNISQTNLGDCEPKGIYPSDGFFVVRGGEGCGLDATSGDRLSVFNWNNGIWEKKVDWAALPSGGCVKKEIYAGKDFIAVSPTTHPLQFNIWMLAWNGIDWVVPSYHYKPPPASGTRFVTKSITGANNSFAVATSVTYSGGDVYDRYVDLHHKLQDNVDSKTYNFVVDKKTVSDATSNKKNLTSYTFEDGNFDTEKHSAKYNKVSVLPKNLGKTVQYFFNNTTLDGQDTRNTQYVKLDGMPYRTAIFDKINATAGTTPLSTSNVEYTVYRNAAWPVGIYQKRIESNTTTSYGVTTGSQILQYNNINGLPTVSRVVNSDGAQKLSKTFFAFENVVYAAAMGTGTGGAYMLAAPCQTVVYEKALGVTTIEPAPSEMRTAQSITYANTLGCTAWLPHRSYTWNSGFNSDGTPIVTYVDFDHTSGATNPNWQYTGSVTRYNPNSQPLETGKPTPTGNQSLSAMVYGHGNVLPVGSITNANFLECGVFTCDYDQNELYNGNYYFDKANGWEKCGSVLSTTKKHFGEKTVYANLPAGTTAFGPSRNVALSYNTDYVFSAWVLVVSGELVINGNYRGRTNSENPILPNEMNRSFSVPAIRVPAATQWQYVELKIPASTDLPFNIWRLNNGAWAARVYIGEPNGVEAYIDDIRFAPKKAFVTTTYYDQLWRQPVISVDANNKPGKKVTFDSFGRPVQWDKINPSKSVGDAGYATTLQRKAYHIRNELLEGENIQVFLPNGGETFTAEHIMNIHWSSRVAGDVTISYQNADGSDPHNITSAPIVNQQGYGTYEWTIPDDAIGTNRVIKVSSTAAGGCNDASDAPFTIVQNKFGPLTYLSPSNGANVGPGSNVTLSWKGSGYTTGVISYRVWFRDNMLNVYTWDTENTSLVVSSGYGESRWNVTPIKDGIVGPTGPTWIFIKSIGM